MIFDEIVQALSSPNILAVTLMLLQMFLRRTLGPFEIVWESSSGSKKSLKRTIPRLLSLKRVAKQRDDFKVIFL